MADKSISKTSAPKKATAKPAKSGAIDTKVEVKATQQAAPAVPAPVAKKAPAPRKPRKSGAPPVETFISDEERYRMIAEAAYFRAESCHFKNDPVRDWIEAERDIAILLGEDR
jgi:hypothetical protein